jgi:hypothetical protein
MQTSEECRKRAQECVELAQTATEPNRQALLQLAQFWLVFADEKSGYEQGFKKAS